VSNKSFPRNPYVIGVPLTSDVGFYGRRGVFTFVEDTLEAEHQNVMVLYGQRRVGKTSLLHQLVRRVNGDVVPVYFDLQGKEQQSLGQVLYGLARTVARPLKMKSPEPTRFDNAGCFFRDEFLPSVYEQLDNRRLLLLFDEFDVLGDELTSPEAASETLFPYLQNLITHERQLAFVFVVGRRIEELATHFQAIFKQAAYRRVGLLQPEDARTLIVEPTKDVLTFEDSAIQAILDLTAGHPYFTQLMCSETFNAMKAQNQRIVVEADILDLVDQAIESGHGALTWFWDGLPRAERFIMSAVAHVTDETGLASKEAIRHILERHRIVLTGLELTDAPDRLVEWEMLRHEGPDHYRFVVELVRRWIIRVHPLESARRDVDYISQRAVRLYENAREAHTTGDLEYARDEYRRALDANPNHSGAQLGLAQVMFELGHIEEAIEEFTKAYALDDMGARDGLVRAHLAQGKRLEEADQANEAILQYEQALNISPTDATTRRRLAAIWMTRGREALATKGLEPALELYERALNHDTGETMVLEARSQLEEYARQAEEGGNHEEAFKATRQLRQLMPEDEATLNMEIALWTRRGDALAQAGEGTEAIRAYQQALELRPGDAVLTEKLKAVSAEWEKLIEIDRLFDKAMLAHQAKDWRTAEKSWLELVKMDALNYKGHNIAALLAEASQGHERLKQEQQAIFERGMGAHQSGDWPAAALAWGQLIDSGVETHAGQEIRPLLEEAQAKRAGEGLEPKLSEEKRRGIPRYVWAVVGVIVALVIGGILFTTNPSTQNAGGTAEAARTAQAGLTAAAEVIEGTIQAESATAAPAAFPPPVPEAVSNPEVLYHDDFDQLSSSEWYYKGGPVKTVDGMLEITGAPPWETYLEYQTPLHEGEGVLLLFKYDPDAKFVVGLEIEEWGTLSFRRWGIHVDVPEDLKTNIYEGSSSIGGQSLRGSNPDTWFYLLLAAGQNGEFLMRVWERDNPSEMSEYRREFGEEWRELPWYFVIGDGEGKLYIDSFTKLAFSEIR
jgi:tetratricopeptide (TPR) repeat protein